MKNIIILIVVFLLWFAFAGYFISEKLTFVDWIGSLFIYCIGLQWVIAFILDKTMLIYFGHELSIQNPKHKVPRVFHFIVGLILCLVSTII